MTKFDKEFDKEKESGNSARIEISATGADTTPILEYIGTQC